MQLGLWGNEQVVGAEMYYKDKCSGLQRRMGVQNSAPPGAPWTTFKLLVRTWHWLQDVNLALLTVKTLNLALIVVNLALLLITVYG